MDLLLQGLNFPLVLQQAPGAVTVAAAGQNPLGTDRVSVRRHESAPETVPVPEGKTVPEVGDEEDVPK